MNSPYSDLDHRSPLSRQRRRSRRSTRVRALELLERRDVPTTDLTLLTNLLTEVEPNNDPNGPLVSLDGYDGASAFLDTRPGPAVGTFSFAIDPEQSAIDGSGTLLGFPIVEQAPGSLSAALQGTLEVLLGEDEISLITGGLVDPIAQPGPFQPGNAPADFAGSVSIIIDNALGAFRDLLLEATSSPSLLDPSGSFSASGIDFTIVAGTFAYQFLTLSGTTGLSGQGGSNAATDPGQLSVLSDHLELTVPVDVSVSFEDAELGVSITIQLAGTVVATAPLPGPADATDCFQITLAAGQKLTVQTSTDLDQIPIPGTDPLDPSMRLLGPSGNLVAQDADSADGINPRITYVAPESGVYTICVDADSGTGAYLLSYQTEELAAPTISIAGPTNVVRGEPATYTLTVDTDPDDPTTEFTYAIDWNFDGVVDQYLEGPSGIQLTHVFPDAGPTGILAVAVNDFGALAGPTSLFVQVDSYRLVSDGDVTSLLYGGTTGSDLVFLIDAPDHTVVLVELLLDGVPVENFYAFPAVTGNVLIYGQAGDDIVYGELLANTNLVIFGGDGNDFLLGGAGTDVLIGEEGNDFLSGGPGADGLLGGNGDDILVGGTGADFLAGGVGSNLVLTGSTNFSDPVGAALALMAEWSSGRDLETRVENLSGTGEGPRENGDYFLIPGSTAIDDDVVDAAIVDQPEDWVIADVDEDLLAGLLPSQVVTDL